MLGVSPGRRLDDRRTIRYVHDRSESAHQRGRMPTRADGLRRSSAAGVLAPPEMSLPAPPASDRSTWAEDRLDPATVGHLRDRATGELGSPWPLPLAHSYARYFRDGDRDEYEQVVFARQRRLSRAAVMA